MRLGRVMSKVLRASVTNMRVGLPARVQIFGFASRCARLRERGGFQRALAKG